MDNCPDRGLGDFYPVTLDIENLYGSSIVFVIHSLDLRWSENLSTTERLLKTCHRFKDACYLLKELFRQG